MKRLLSIIMFLGAVLCVRASEGSASVQGGFLEDHWAYIVAIVVIWILYFRIAKRQDKNKNQ
ncbi:MAG: hypothetical protein R3Y49_00630 [Rikenellaceae bacterium]